MFKKCLIATAALGAVVSAHAFDQGHISILNPPSGAGGNFIGFLQGFGPVGGFAGLLNFSEVDFTNPGNSLGPIVGFCGDVTAAFPPPFNWDVNIYDPHTTFGSANVTAAGNMVANVANLLGGDLNLLSNQEAFALQLDVWECIYDGPGEGSPDFSNGIFTVSQEAIPNGAFSPLSAGTLLDAAAFWGFRNVAMDAIFLQAEGNNHEGPLGQDLFTVHGGGTHVFTPEPITMSLGFAGIGLFVRRRAAKKS